MQQQKIEDRNLNHINIWTWDHLSEVLDFSFWSSKGGLVLVPSPAHADFVRSLLLRKDGPQREWTVSTIAEFLASRLQKQWGHENFKQKYLGKTQLKMMLARSYRQKFSFGNLGDFENAFKQYTDLRTYTTDNDLMTELLDLLPSSSSQICKFFQAIFTLVDQVDEAQAYKEVDLARDQFSHSEVVFYGFSLLSGVQTDFLKRLAEVCSVQVVLPSFLYQRGKSSDWFHWLKVEKINSLKKDSQDSQSVREIKVPAVVAPLGLIPEMMKKLSQDQPLTKVVVPVLSFTAAQVLYFQAPYGNQKIKIDLFQDALACWKEQIEILLSQSDKQVLNNELINEIVKSKIDSLYSEKKLPELKVWLVFGEVWKKYCALSDVEAHFSFFEQALFTEIIGLDLPRVSAIALNNHKHSLSPETIYQSLASLDKSPGPWAMVFNPSWLPKISSEKVFPKDVEEKLLALGPLPRAMLPLLELQAYCLDYMGGGEGVIFYPPELTEKDVQWAGFFQDIVAPKELSANQDLTPGCYLPSGRYFLDGKISVSAFQAFLQCPRKYYQSYLENYSGYLEVPSELNAAEKGNLLHLLIQQSLHVELKAENLKVQLTSWLDQWLTKNSKELSSLERQLLEIEIIAILPPLLEQFHLLLEVNGGNLTFESPHEFMLGDIRLYGRSDCLIKSEHGVRILDFKKSKSSVPTQQDFRNYQASQLWCYGVSVDRLLGVGYVTLDGAQNPFQLYGDWGTYKSVPVDFTQSLPEFKNFAKENIERLLLEKDFNPQPVNATICRYCDFQRFCPRGGLDEDSE